jgi:hypothetical protein
MAEGNPDTAILVAISFQAMQRLKHLPREDTRVADTTVMLFFAAVYLEGTVDYIVGAYGKKRSMFKFLYPRGRGRHQHPGLKQKLAWLHNACIAQDGDRCNSRSMLTYRKIGARLRYMFPGFRKLNDFRNTVGHGRVLEVSFGEALALRKETKATVDRLYDAAEDEWSKPIERITTYRAATEALKKYARSL